MLIIMVYVVGFPGCISSVDQQLEIYLDRYIIKLIKLHEVYINLSLVYLLKFEITIIF